MNRTFSDRTLTLDDIIDRDAWEQAEADDYLKGL